jgi:hypothetical protein
MKQFSLLPVAIGAFIALTVSNSAAAETAGFRSTPSILLSFQKFWAAAHGQAFSQQEADWDKYIEKPRAAFYKQVVWQANIYPNWKAERRTFLQARFSLYPRTAGRIVEQARALETDIPVYVAKFKELFPNAPAHPAVYVVLAPNFDAKSAVLPDGTPVLVFSVDQLTLERANLSIVLPHELFHFYNAIHAGIKDDGVMPDANLSLPLFAEGLATYVSTAISPEYTDCQYLMQQSLCELPDADLPEIAQRFLVDANAEVIDPGNNGAAYLRWFAAGTEQRQTGLPNRTGYWLGLHVIREVLRTHSLQQVASWSPAVAQQKTRAELEQLAAKHRVAR